MIMKEPIIKPALKSRENLPYRGYNALNFTKIQKSTFLLPLYISKPIHVFPLFLAEFLPKNYINMKLNLHYHGGSRNHACLSLHKVWEISN